ncbi:MAG TPA: M20/M25/M40 family metallo-hydrolase [Candidatus Sulfotelmatobacter sp.]|jgi:carboxypeptidase Q|nr:M20/M25/M40 family metallo-hydrolase [Candidatus Sulfotelmatobacter sp.]
MRLPKLLCATLFAFTPVLALAQSSAPSTTFSVSPETREAVRAIIGDSTLNGKAYALEGELADTIGPRLTGSSNYMRAADWAVQQFKSLGLANVHTEEWTIPSTWEPGPATGMIKEPVVHELHIYSVGWSTSTPPQGVEGPVVYVSSFAPAALDAQRAQITGKIAIVDPASYGEKPTMDGVLSGYERLQSFSPAAILTMGIANGAESMGTIGFGGKLSPVPAAQIGREDSSLIKRLLGRGPVSVHFSLSNAVHANVNIPTIIAEIPGRDLPDEVVIVGAHLDSWQPGTGAQDNGTGVASVLESARAIKAANRAPRRTIRFILFGGEEEGLIGSGAYARQHAAEMPKIAAVLVTDSGSQPAKGWNVTEREDEKGSLEALKPLLSGLGADGITSDATYAFQTDYAAFDVLGVPTLVLWNDMDKYMLLHHKASDTFDSVVEKDLVQGAVVCAVTAYAIADSESSFAPHLSPADAQSMIKKAGRLDEYNYLKSGGVLP